MPINALIKFGLPNVPSTALYGFAHAKTSLPDAPRSDKTAFIVAAKRKALKTLLYTSLREINVDVKKMIINDAYESRPVFLPKAPYKPLSIGFELAIIERIIAMRNTRENVKSVLLPVNKFLF